MKFDDIFVHLGNFGPYQKWIYFLVCFPAIPAAFQMLATVFILAIPKHRCSIPGLANDSYAVRSPQHRQLISKYIPLTVEDGEQTYSKCNLYQQGHDGTVTNSNSTQTPCTSWVYDRSVFESTVITDFNLVCEDHDVRSHANMVLMAGLLVGSLGLGLLSDMIGRKKAFMCGLVAWLVSSLCVAFSPNVIAFIIFRFVVGACGVGLFMCMFVLGLELVGPPRRTVAGMGIMLVWCVGLFVLGGIAYGVRNWKYLQIAITLPTLLAVPLWWLIPESPRWLISKGRKKEAAAIIEKLAMMNGVLLPRRVMRLDVKEQKQEKVWAIFTSPVLVVRSLIIFFNWCVVSMVYYGLGLNVGSLGGDIYVNFTIANIVETVSYVLCIALLDRVGRKVLHCASMLIGGIACILTIFPVLYGDKSTEWVTISLAMVGKLGISAAFAIIYVFTAELFPTVVRNSMMGSSSLCARFGGIASPYIADLGNLIEGNFSKALPLMVFGALSVGAGLLSLLLPETLNKKLPESINDAINFGSKEEEESTVRYEDFNSSSEPTNSEIPSDYPSTSDLSLRKDSPSSIELSFRIDGSFNSDPPSNRGSRVYDNQAFVMDSDKSLESWI